MRVDLYEQGGYSGGGITENGGNISGPLLLAGNPSQTLEAVPKQYVDAYFNSINAGNFVAGTLPPARLPGFTGDLQTTEGQNSFSLANSGIVAGSYPKVTVNSKGIVTGGFNISDADIPFGVDWSKINSNTLPTTLTGYGVLDGVSINGGTLTGFLTLTQNPTSSLHAANKQYVDSLVSSGGISVGDILRKPYSTTPSGFLRCNGGEADKTTYANLYAVIGDSFNKNNVAGSGQPWCQQYQINTTQSGETSPWISEATGLPAAFYYSAVAVTKNRVYTFGAWNGAYTSLVYTAPINADGTLGTWAGSNSLPAAMCATNVFITKNRLFIAGGYSGNASATTAVYSAVINSDGTLGTWSTESNLPGPIGFSNVVVTKNRIYVLGGSNGTSGTNIVYTATINSDGAISTWSTGTSLPASITNGAIAVTKNRVYLLGGAAAGVYSATVYTAIINTDGTLGTWTVTNSLPEAIGASQSFIVKNTLYITGGVNGSISLNKVFMSNIKADGTLGDWILSNNTLPLNMWGGKTFITKNKVYMCAGQNGNAGSLTSAILSASINGGLNDYSSYYSDDETNYIMPGAGKPWQQQYQINSTQAANLNSWTSGTNLPGGLFCSSTVVTKNRVYLLGGWNGTTLVSTVYTAPINPDGTLGSWTTDVSLPTALYSGQVITIKNKVHLIGGSNVYGLSTGTLNTIYTASINSDGTIGNWSLNTLSLPTTISSHQAVVTKNRIYVIGGNNGSSNLSTVYSVNVNSDGTLGTWTTGIPLPVGLFAFQAFITKNRIYVLGGWNGAAYINANTNIYTATINSDGYIGSWTISGTTPATVSECVTFITNNTVYIFGGHNGVNTTNAVYTSPIDANGKIGSWFVGTSLPIPLRYPCMFGVNNKLYIVSGVTTDGNITTNSYLANITGSINDYSSYYDGTIIPNEVPDSSTKFLLPDFTGEEPFGSYSYIKY